MNVWAKRVAAAVALMCAAALGAMADDVQALVAAISDPSADVRAQAWEQAAPLGAAAVLPLADPLGSDDPEVALAAAKALDNIVDHAGRPGAQAEQAAVAAELTKLLDPARKEGVRREAVRLLALGGTEAEVPALAALLNDPALAQDACLTLEEIPGAAAGRALADALATASPEVAPRIAAALGRRGDEGAREALTQAARTGEGETRWASLDALARLGVSPLEAFEPTGLTEPELARYAGAFLTAANAQAARGDRARAERMYGLLAQHATRPHHALAALRGLAEVGSPATARAAVGLLDRAEIRTEVAALLTGAQVPDLDRTLAEAYGQAGPAAKTGILEVLGRRQAEAFPALIDAARNDASAEVRVAALEMAGEEVPADRLEEAMATGSPHGRVHAARLYLALAQDREADDAARAAGMYEGIVRADLPAGLKITAFAGLERLARPEALPMLDELVAPLYAPGAEPGEGADPALLDAAGRAYVATHAARGREQAMPVLVAVLENTDSLDVSALAAQKLAEFGVDPQALARQKGFITDWKILGPFPNEDWAAADTAFIDEAAGVLPETVEFQGAQYRPQDAVTEGLPAVLDFRRHYRDAFHRAAYAYAELRSDGERPVLFLVGSDDGCELWVNGEKVLSAAYPRSLMVDNDRVEATLKPGPNRVLIKVLQGVGDWRFCVRVADRDGQPLDVGALR